MNILDLPKLGPKTYDLLKKLGINDIDDLITYYPFRYELIKYSNISEVSNGDKVIFGGIIESTPQVFYIKKSLNRLTFNFNSNGRLFKVVIFNRAFL